MAIYIYMHKEMEDQSGAVYIFGPSEQEIIGSVFIDRATRQVSLLHIDYPQQEAFYFPRVSRVLQQVTSEYPDTTCYAA